MLFYSQDILNFGTNQSISFEIKSVLRMKQQLFSEKYKTTKLKSALAFDFRLPLQKNHIKILK